VSLAVEQAHTAIKAMPISKAAARMATRVRLQRMLQYDKANIMRVIHLFLQFACRKLLLIELGEQ
jgi:hypothetical protein